jgi:hypothetical protein
MKISTQRRETLSRALCMLSFGVTFFLSCLVHAQNGAGAELISNPGATACAPEEA